MKKFNGWQRLWVVASVVALPFVVTVWRHEFRDSFPTEESARDRAQRAALEWVRVEVDEGALRACVKRQLPSGGAPLPELTAVMADCREKLGGKPSQEMVRLSEGAIADGEAYIRSGLRADQAKALMVPLGAWMALCLMVYLAGAAIAWVIRGFFPARTEA